MTTDQEALKNVSANLRRILRDRAMTQAELARKTGDSQPAISQICTAKYVPGIGLVLRIAEALDVTVDRLLAPPPSPPVPHTAHNISENFSHST